MSTVVRFDPYLRIKKDARRETKQFVEEIQDKIDTCAEILTFYEQVRDVVAGFEKTPPGEEVMVVIPEMFDDIEVLEIRHEIRSRFDMIDVRIDAVDVSFPGDSEISSYNVMCFVRSEWF